MIMCSESATATKTAPKREISHADIAARSIAGFSYFRKGTMRIVAVLAFGLLASPVFAASVSLNGEQASKASTAVDFRIVIPETLHIGSQSIRRARSQPFISRTTQVEAGRTVVTVARP